MLNIPWDQPATLIDLEGKTRTWILTPDERALLVQRLTAEERAAR